MPDIKAVLSEEDRLASQPRFDSSSRYYKICVHHPPDLVQIRAELAHCVGDALEAVHFEE